MFYLLLISRPDQHTASMQLQFVFSTLRHDFMKESVSLLLAGSIIGSLLYHEDIRQWLCCHRMQVTGHTRASDITRERASGLNQTNPHSLHTINFIFKRCPRKLSSGLFLILPDYVEEEDDGKSLHHDQIRLLHSKPNPDHLCKRGRDQPEP